MAAEIYNSNERDTKPTHSTGNAEGKPIRPILFGVFAVVALILISLALSYRSNREEVTNSNSRNGQQIRYSNAESSSRMATERGGVSDTASRPATAPMTSETGNGTSMSGSSSLPDQSTGQNFVAPPGPSANKQGTNR